MQFLYLGPWYHFDPLNHFINCKKFIYIDTQPRTQWDFVPNTLCIDAYCNNFINLIKSDLTKLGFNLISSECLNNDYIKYNRYYEYNFETTVVKTKIIEPNDINNILKLYPFINPHLLVFYNEQTNQTLKYYISTNIKYTMTEELKNDIESSTDLICAGFSPDIQLLPYIKNPINFYGYTGTCYEPDYDIPDADCNFSLFNFLFYANKENNYEQINKYFSSFTVINIKTGELIQTISYDDFIKTNKMIYKQTNKDMDFNE